MTLRAPTVTETVALPHVDGSPSARLAASARSLARSARRLAFLAIAAILLLGPAPGQLFGFHSAFLREWVMFAGVGVGIPKGEFTLYEIDGEVSTLAPTEVLGITSYPLIRHYLFDARILEDEDLAHFASPLCSELGEGARLTFAGFVGTRDGWRALGSDDVCNGGGSGAADGSEYLGERP